MNASFLPVYFLAGFVCYRGSILVIYLGTLICTKVVDDIVLNFKELPFIEREGQHVN